MSESQDFDKPEVAEQSKKESRLKSSFLASTREIIAILFWVYVIMKLFIFDVDLFLVEKFSPDFVWLLNYKFFILIGTIATIWLVSKNRNVLLWTLFIFFYPAIILLWRIPFFVFKQRSWILAFAIIDAIISFFKSVKFTFVTTSFYLVSTAIIFRSSNAILL
ncbi:MAG TPA: hypothetical protein VF918_00635 [Anaerolineales bacterium]